MTSNKLLLCLCLLFIAKISVACNSCSQLSIAGSGGLVLKNVLNNYVSLQIMQNSFVSNNGEHEQSSDKLLNYELMIKKSITNKLYAWGAIPYNRNTRKMETVEYSRNGLGDIRLGLDYKFNTIQVTDSLTLVPILSAGIKSPMGHYEHYIVSQGMPNSFNLGSGSWGAIVNPMIRMRYKKLGGVLSGTILYQGRNKYDYRYGLQKNLTTTIFYKLYEKKKCKLLPMAGFSLDHMQSDSPEVKKSNPLTGGYSFQLQCGLTLVGDRHVFAAEVRNPLSQSYADNTVRLKHIVSLRYTYLLKNQKQTNIKK
jgi:hypothetical protein